MTIFIALAALFVGGTAGFIAGVVISHPRKRGDRGSREAQDIAER